MRVHYGWCHLKNVHVCNLHVVYGIDRNTAGEQFSYRCLLCTVYIGTSTRGEAILLWRTEPFVFPVTIYRGISHSRILSLSAIPGHISRSLLSVLANSYFKDMALSRVSLWLNNQHRLHAASILCVHSQWGVMHCDNSGWCFKSRLTTTIGMLNHNALARLTDLFWIVWKHY